MTPIAAVLFDLDGTLVDTAPDFVRVLNQVRADDNLPPLPYDTIRNQVSNGARALVKLGYDLAEESPEFATRLQKLLEHYEKGLAQESHLFPGLNDCLKWLEQREIPWGVVTNKPSRYTVPLLRGLKLHQRCSVTVCPDHVTHKKPHPEPLLTACDWLSVDPAHTIYVGDHVRDIEAGKAAGNLTIAAGWGYLEQGTDIHQWQADAVVQNAAQLQAFLQDKLPN